MAFCFLTDRCGRRVQLAVDERQDDGVSLVVLGAGCWL